MPHQRVTNVIVAGIGGQGVLRSTDLLAQTAFLAGWDVKKTEVHGMSQRGGSVVSDVRFGERVLSPMVPDGEGDFLVIFEPNEEVSNRHRLKSDGVVIRPDVLDARQLPSEKTLNVALLGVLSRHLDFPPELWQAAIRRVFPRSTWEMNLVAFQLGRDQDPKHLQP